MEQESVYFFQLIDTAYAEDLSSQPEAYKKGLLKAATELSNGEKVMKVAGDIYITCHRNYVVPMTLPPKNRALYGFVHDKIRTLSQKQLRDLNIGYGLIATHFSFGPLF